MKKLTFILILLFIIMMGMSSCSLFWSTEKKQRYAFTLLTREVCNNPTVLKQIEITVKKDGKEIIITSKNVNELKKWYYLNGIQVQLPDGYTWDKDFKELGNSQSLLISYDKKCFSSSAFYQLGHFKTNSLNWPCNYITTEEYPYSDSETLQSIRYAKRIAHKM